MAARDRFLNVPDRLICDHILTKLPLKEVIRCSAVSRRWKRFWTLLPALRFTDEFFNSVSSPIDVKKRKSLAIKLGKIINNILLLHYEHIGAFEFHNVYWCSDEIRPWILSAASKGVTEIALKQKSEWKEVPSALFSCDKLVYLSLKRFNFTRTPSYFGGFLCLKTFDIRNVVLHEKAFELLVKLCPLLETMRVLHCTVIMNLKLDSVSLKTLRLEGLQNNSFSSISLVINCPQLTKLEVIGLFGYANNFSVKMEVNWLLLVNLATNNFRMLDRIPISKSVKKLILRLPATCDVNILSKFPNTEELCISYGGLFPLALELKKSRLKKLHVMDSSSLEISALGRLLRNTPSLETVIISLEEGFNSVTDLQFVNGLLSLESGTSKVLLTQPEVTCINCNGAFR